MFFTPEQIRESFQQILQKKRYESLAEFLDAYFEVVEDTYARTEQVRVVNGRIKKRYSTFNTIQPEDEESRRWCEDSVQDEEDVEDSFEAMDTYNGAVGKEFRRGEARSGDATVDKSRSADRNTVRCLRVGNRHYRQVAPVD